MIRAIGLDPDLTTTAWALVEAETKIVASEGSGRTFPVLVPRLVEVGVMRGRANTHGFPILLALGTHDFPRADVALVESMQVYSGAKAQAPTADLMALQAIGGAAVAALHRAGCQVEFLTPGLWKGQVDKKTHHERTAVALGFNISRGKPGNLIGVKGAETVGRGTWRHLLDAAGMALWAIEHSAEISMRYRVMREAV